MQILSFFAPAALLSTAGEKTPPASDWRTVAVLVGLVLVGALIATWSSQARQQKRKNNLK